MFYSSVQSSTPEGRVRVEEEASKNTESGSAKGTTSTLQNYLKMACAVGPRGSLHLRWPLRGAGVGQISAAPRVGDCRTGRDKLQLYLWLHFDTGEDYGLKVLLSARHSERNVTWVTSYANIYLGCKAWKVWNKGYEKWVCSWVSVRC